MTGLSGPASRLFEAGVGGLRGGWKRLLGLVAADMERVGVIRAGRRTRRADLVQDGGGVG